MATVNVVIKFIIIASMALPTRCDFCQVSLYMLTLRFPVIGSEGLYEFIIQFLNIVKITRYIEFANMFLK